MNKTICEGKEFFQELSKNINKDELKKEVEFGFAVPSVFLEKACDLTKDLGVLIAAQDVHQNESGAFTGDISGHMIRSTGAKAVIIGHSERREYHNENNEILNKKVFRALENKLRVIFCIGEKLSEREVNSLKELLKTQVEEGLDGLSKEQIERVVIAYEPIWAIGTGVTASADQAQEACEYVRDLIKNKFSTEVAEKILIQYGGSVNPSNIADLMSKKDIDGALVGGASLKVDSFIKLINL